MKQINMLDLKAEYKLFRDEIRTAVDDVLESQYFINGPAIAELESALASRVGVPHAIAVSSGTDALLATLMAMGVGAGDDVIVPAFTFFATAGAVSRLGATPVFVDVDPRTFNIDPAGVERAITPKTKAILVVHLFGQCAEMDELNAIAAKHGIKVIEDAAQALGAQYRDRAACSLADAACVSFYPTKNLGGFGEGGMVFTGDDRLAETIRQMRNHGESRRYHHDRVGGNFRLDTMKAAILLVKLKHFAALNESRFANATRYNDLLAPAAVTTPFVDSYQSPVYHQYSILSDRRDELAAHLKENGIGSGIYYPVPLHQQECFQRFGGQSLPVCEDLARRILSIPCHPMLSEEDVTTIASCVIGFESSVSSSPAGTSA